MSNRKARRAAAATNEFPDLPPMQNVSGNSQCCGNCPKRADEKALAFNRHMSRQEKMPDDKVLCLAVPGGGTTMFKYGWCALWGEPNVVKIAKDDPK
jgi:predicted ATP-grasp superfamily ATP-dependent carboligase